MTWEQWAAWYSQTFGIDGEDGAAMLVSWVHLFRLRGWSVEDVFSVSKQVTLATFGDPNKDPYAAPRYRTEHLAALTVRMTDLLLRRGVETARQHQDAEIRCPLCDNVGIICGMPHPRPTPLNRHATTAVVCACAIGVLVRQKQPMIQLDEYERYVPDWRERVRARDEERKARLEAEATAGFLDKSLGAILKRLTSRDAAMSGAEREDKLCT